MLEYPQCASTAWMLEARLQRKHLADPEREAFRNSHVGLGFARRPIAGIENRSQLMPPLGRRGFDDSRDRSVEQQSEQKRRRDRLVRHDPLVRVLQALHEQLLDETPRMRLDIAIHGG